MMPIPKIASLAMLPAVLVLVACQGESRQQEAAPAAAQQEVAQAAFPIEIVNPMPHAMTVTAEYGGQTVELGTVEPMGTTTFSLTAPANTIVKLTAADEAKSHAVHGEVTLSSELAPSWTVGR